MEQTRKKKLTGGQILICTILILFCLMILYPLLYILAVSLSSNVAVMQGDVWLWPVGFNLDSYKEILHYDNFLNSYWNTVRYTAVDTALALLINTLTAYPLSRRHFRGRRAFNLYFTFTMLFSGGLIAQYINMKSLGLLDSIWAILLPSCCGAYNLILVRTFFESIPVELEESALIDGANDFTIFSRVTIPLSGPIISTMVLFFAVHRWNSWFNEFIYLNDKAKQPLQLIIRTIVLGSENISSANSAMLGQSLKFAAIVLAMIPMLILYPFIQKYLVKGIMLGSVKG